MPVQAEGMRNFLDVLRPASGDEVGESLHFWIADEGLLESFLEVWHYVGMVDSISNGRLGPGWGLNGESVSGMTISLPGQ